jgi:hypothetical protein
MLFGGVAVVVVVILLVVMNRGGDGAANGEPAKATPGAAERPGTPPANPTPAPAAGTFAAKAGKTPGRPAPPLAQTLLDQCFALLAQGKALSNEGVKLRLAGDNEQARAKQSAASDKVEEIKRLTTTNWAWQEEAELGDWALPAEYVRLGSLYTEIGKLENQVRKGGGTR